MNNSRLYEYYQRVLRIDMLTRFSNIIELKSIETCMVLDAIRAVQSDLKYKSACLLELLTGKRPQVGPCDIKREGLSEAAAKTSKTTLQADAIRLKSAVMSQHKGVVLTAEDYRKAATTASGLKLSSVISDQEEIFLFIEKVREFCLPDMLSLANDMPLTERLQSASRKEVASYYRKPIFTSKGLKSRAIFAEENPTIAMTSFHLKTTDFLRFPDIELFFEPLSSILGQGHLINGKESALSVYIRPILQVIPSSIPYEELFNQFNLPYPKSSVDNLRMMNYFLSRLFNPFIDRIRVGVQPPKAPQPPEHVGLLNKS